MARNNLVVLHQGLQIGTLSSDARGRLQFIYSNDWLSNPAPVPLSLSMPVIPQEYTGEKLTNWLWGLLPDDPSVLRRMAVQVHASPHNVFSLLSNFGEDVAGAVQFVTPERVQQTVTEGNIRWLTEEELDQRFTMLQQDASNTRRLDDPGRFSLAGAQAKVALLEQDGRWGVPSGRVPTNRIVKLASGMYDGLIENEHFCIKLVNAVGLNGVESRVVTRSGVTAIVVDRYDRIEMEDGNLIRVHQEDMCQANGVHPHNRYENEGGPGVLQILDTLNASSEPVEDRENFIRAQVVNFLLGGSDAHAKNFSVLLGADRVVRLAPLYDIASIFPYQDYKKSALAMKIGNSYSFEYTLPRHWAALGRRLGDRLLPIRMLEEYATLILEVIEDVFSDVKAAGITHPVLPRLVDSIKSSCVRCLNQLRFYDDSN